VANNAFVDITKKSVVVAKNELKKYLRGKKILICAGLMIFILAIMISVPYLLGDGLPEDPLSIAFMFTMFAYLLAAMTAILFAATAIVSEFEERTALITFTKPVRRSSIFLGKFMASSLIAIVFVLLYFVAVIVVSLCVTGEVAPELYTAIGLTLLYTMACTGLAMLFSSIMKKGSTATLLTLMTLFLLLSIISQVVSMALSDPNSVWWMLDTVAMDIFGVLNSSNSIDVLKSASVMIGWCAIPTVLSYLIFRRKNF